MTARLLCLGVFVFSIIAAVPLVQASARDGWGREFTAVAGAQASVGAISGEVVEARTGKPIAAAVVGIQKSPAASPAGSSVARFSHDEPRVVADEVLSDGAGRFMFQGAPVGHYVLSARRQGYLETGQGSAADVEVTANQSSTSVRLSLWRAAVVEGVVSDEFARPSVDRAITLLKWQAGRGVWTPASTARTDDRGQYRLWGLSPGDYVVCSDATIRSIPQSRVAAYRLAMRTAGQFSALSQELMRSGDPVNVGPSLNTGGVVIQSTGSRNGQPLFPVSVDSNGSLSVYRTTCSPSAPDTSSATIMSLLDGETDEADIGLIRASAVKVTGRVLQQGAPVSDLQLGLRQEADRFLGREEYKTVSESDGSFTFPAVAPGRYLLRTVRLGRARPLHETAIVNGVKQETYTSLLPNSSAPKPTSVPPMMWAEEEVAVGSEDVANVSLDLRPGLTLQGVVRLDRGDGGRLPSLESRFPPGQLSLLALDQGEGTSGVGAASSLTSDDRFSLTGYPPGLYRLLANPRSGSPPLFLDSAAVEGRDISDVPFELTENRDDIVVTLTDKLATLEGTVRASATSEKLAVVVMPRASDAWGRSFRRERIVSVDHGAYHVAGLPGGDYLAVVVPASMVAFTDSRSVWERCARVAVQVTLRTGETKVLGLDATVLKRP